MVALMSMRTSRSTNAPSVKTRLQLILAGETLFAEHGIDSVSLRQINSAAGQKNSSAAHYHFGSRENLVQAIYAWRMKQVNERRLEYVKRLQKEGRETDVRALVEAIVLPIVDEIQEGENGSHYIRFIAQLVGHPRLILQEVWENDLATGMSRIAKFMNKALPDIPASLIRQRFGLMWEQAIHALADQERLTGSGRHGLSAKHDLFVSNLVDTIAGGLMAPVSEQTRKNMKKTGGRRRRAS